MKNLLKPAVFFICLFTTFLLALVYGVTAPTIAARSISDQIKLQQEVLPEADAFDVLEKAEELDEKQEVKEVYAAKKDGTLVGYLYIIETNAYGGTMRVMVGVDRETQSIKGLRLISHQETPGLGANAAEASFYDKFVGKTGEPALVVAKAGQGSGAAHEIDAIASATITSSAVTKTAQTALDMTERLIEEGIE